MMTAQKDKSRILKSCYNLPIGESIKTEYVLTSNGRDHYEGLVFSHVKFAENMLLKIKQKRDIDVKIKKIRRLIYRDPMWEKNEYVEIKTLRGDE